MVLSRTAAAGGKACVAGRSQRRADQRKAEERNQEHGKTTPHAIMVTQLTGRFCNMCGGTPTVAPSGYAGDR